tara:strand:- start:3349 stop:4302 length:954 start_codon:yes stop_codon:yes gene_type:complete
MVKLGRKQFLGWKAETTAGTAIAIANANYHLVEDVSFEFSGDEHERVGNLGSLDSMKGVTGSIVATISFTTEFKGSGADGTPFPDLDLWKASGFECGESDYSGGSMIVEQATPAEMKTVSIRYFADGMQYDMKGAVGTCTLTMESGSVGKTAWTFTGMCDGMPSDGTNPTPSYNTTVPPVCQNTTLTLDGGTAFGVCSNLSFDFGNEIANRRDMTQTFGYAIPTITRRMGTGSMTVEIPTSAAYNWQTAWNNKNKIDGSITVGAGGSNHNTMAVTWDMALTSSPAATDSDGIMLYEIEFQLITNDLVGDNTFAVTYT